MRRIIGVALSKNDHLADAFKEIRGYIDARAHRTGLHHWPCHRPAYRDAR